jgi:hypothetical protein
MTTITVPSHDYAIDINCAVCGATLTAKHTSSRSADNIEAEPCETCLSKKADTNYQLGYDEGFEAAKDE